MYCTEGTPAGGLSTAYSEASSIGGGSDTEDGVVDVDAAIASAAADVQVEHGGEEAEGEDRNGDGAAVPEIRQPLVQPRQQQQPSTSGQRMLAAKSVTFNPHQSDQTPLMFSRASSYDSLNSFDQGLLENHFQVALIFSRNTEFAGVDSMTLADVTRMVRKQVQFVTKGLDQRRLQQLRLFPRHFGPRFAQRPARLPRGNAARAEEGACRRTRAIEKAPRPSRRRRGQRDSCTTTIVGTDHSCERQEPRRRLVFVILKFYQGLSGKVNGHHFESEEVKKRECVFFL